MSGPSFKKRAAWFMYRNRRRIYLAFCWVGLKAKWVWHHFTFNERQQYGGIFAYYEKITELYEDEVPPAIKKQCRRHMEFVVPKHLRANVTYIHQPPLTDMSDPLNKPGYYSWKYTPRRSTAY